MNFIKRDKKDEDAGNLRICLGGGGNPYANLDKTSVLQEARIFNETPINARKCCHILTKILYLLNQGETFGRTEATECFFAVTKLWQVKDATLRRMMYLCIKELCPLADDVIIVTSSLTKDMTGKEDIYRAAAIRTLTRITDSTMLQAIERYMKQAVVDKVPAVASAALVSSLHLMKQSPDVVRRWVNEVQEAVNSDNMMVQLHALGLLYQIRKQDRLAVNKLVQKFSRQALKSPYAVCYLIRITSTLIEEEEGTPQNPLFDFLESCLRHKCELVIYEAASAIVNLRHVTSRELSPAISVLQLFCSSPKPALRFAAVRTLNKVAMTHPAAVTVCNVDLEQLISDQNRSVATLAITTLLKTGQEASVDRLMKQISSFVNEISDEFKIVVIDAIRSLCLRYPRKHVVMMNFLSTMLRDEGGFEYKKAICDTLINIIEDNPDAKETGLAHLCEFIEDCEHASLAIRILHLMGREGPRTQQPNKYIRFIYNRVILEAPAVRAAAVSALAKFGAHCPDLLPSIRVLLTRCLMDQDDECRDRAAYYLTLLDTEDRSIYSKYILEGMQVSVVGLERALQNYLADPNRSEPFDLRHVPMATQQPALPVEKKVQVAAEAEALTLKKDEKIKATRQDIYAEQLAAIPEIAKCGPVFRSGEPAQLTESETEYNVQCIKHTFDNHLVLQFDCRNTMNDQLLENVKVHIETAWEIVTQIPCDQLPYNKPGTAYVILKYPDDISQSCNTLQCTLKFLVRDCDPNNGIPESDEGYPDEYLLEDVEVGIADNCQRLVKPNFQAAWEELSADNHLENTYALSTIHTIEDGVQQVLALLGLGICDRSDRVPEGKTTHSLLMSGVFRGGHPVLARAKFVLTQDGSVTLNFAVRSDSADISEVIASAIG